MVGRHLRDRAPAADHSSVYVAHTVSLVKILVALLVREQFSRSAAVGRSERLVEVIEDERSRWLGLVCHDFGQLTGDRKAVTINVKIVVVIVDYELVNK